MMQIRAVTRVPAGFDLHLDKASGEMWDAVSQDVRDSLCGRSKRIWLVYCNGEPVFVVGLRITSLVGTRAELWFLTGRALPKYRREVVVFIKRALRKTLRMYRHLSLTVNADFRKGIKFAEFFGFERTMSLGSIDGIQFEVYEKRA